MTNIGKAYGFFDCRASKQEIEAEIPTIRGLVRSPSEGLVFMRMMENINF